MQSLNQLILKHAKPLAESGDWQGVADCLNAPLTRTRTTKAHYVEVYTLLGDDDMRHTLAVMSQDIIGKGGVDRMNDSSDAGGMYFSHPITVKLIESLRSQLNPGVADKLLSLGFVQTTLAKEAGIGFITAEDCRAAYLAGADVLLSVNITGGLTLCSLQVIRDGKQVKLQSLTEGQGSVADQALLASIESAIQTFLLEA
jgi:hypothetical protein